MGWRIRAGGREQGGRGMPQVEGVGEGAHKYNRGLKGPARFQGWYLAVRLEP